MGKSLYRSYRSQSFDEIVGQEHIVTTLRNSLKNDTVSHAYLLSGPRGVGKTSIARVMAYAVNDAPYESENTNLDIIEIDAASNRRIDEIREIRERVHIAPTSGKYKVYIIDEVHMLTKEAFNALLKTLEEPPKHVIFILATTEIHKVPETIISRCIRFTFKPISVDVLAAHLKMIAKKEKIQINNGALNMLAEHGRGSFRDAITLLDQVNNSADTITEEEVSLMLGLAPATVIDEIINAIEGHDLQSILKSIQNAYESGSHETMLCNQLSNRLRSMVVASNNDNTWSIPLLRELLDVPGSPKPRVALELALVTAALASTPQYRPEPESSTNLPAPDTQAAENLKPQTKPVKPMVSTPKDPEHQEIIAPSKPIEDTPQPAPKTPLSKDLSNDELWKTALNELKINNTTLYGVMRMAEVTRASNNLVISFKFAFHYKQVTDTKNNAVISKILASIYGQETAIDYQLQNQTKQKADIESGLKNVTNIFGGHELLES